MYARALSALTLVSIALYCILGFAQNTSPPALKGGHADSVWDVAFSPDGKFLASGSSDETVNVWNLLTGDLKTFRPHDGWVHIITFRPDSGALVAASEKGVTIWGLPEGQLVKRLETGELRRSVLSSGGGQVLAVTNNWRESKLLIWDLSKGEVLSAFTPGGGHSLVEYVAFHPSAAVLAYATFMEQGEFDDTIRFWNFASSHETRKITKANQGHGPISAIAFGPGGRLLASASSEGVRLWDSASGKLVGSMLGHAENAQSGTNYIASVRFSPTAPVLATADGAGDVDIWDYAASQKLRTLKHPDSVSAIAFSPDGKLLASACADGVVRLWDVASGTSLAASTRYFWTKQVGIRVLFPPDWAKLQEEEATFSKPAMVVLGKSETMARITLAHEVVEASADLYRRALESSMSTTSSEYQTLGEKKVRRGGLEGVRLVATWKTGTTQIRAYVEIFSSGKQHFRVVALAPTEVFSRYEEEFDGMMESVEFPELHP